MRLRGHHSAVPELQMTAMPDLIFTVLFFFMIVTHMRENTIKVEYHQPEAANLVKVTNKAAVINVYVGRAIGGEDYQVQVADDVVPLSQLSAALREAREAVSADQMEHLSATLQADRQVPMSYINKVKMALREARILRVTYAATQLPAENKEYENNK